MEEREGVWRTKGERGENHKNQKPKNHPTKKPSLTIPNNPKVPRVGGPKPDRALTLPTTPLVADGFTISKAIKNPGFRV